MSYVSLRDALDDLRRQNQLLVIEDEVDPNLEAAEIHRRIYQKKGPALLFANLKGSGFKGCSNLYGTNERCEYLFRDALKGLELLIKIKSDPMDFFRRPLSYIQQTPYFTSGLPRQRKHSEILDRQCRMEDLPAIVGWPGDGGPFITLPQVISFPPGSNAVKDANIGMYRIQMSGNDYLINEEAGLHYQLHRGIGIHHRLYNDSDEPFRVTIAVGGPPSHALAAIFPLPEGLSEILFTGLLGNRAYRYSWHEQFFIPSDVDFCITGIVQKNNLKPEGPFGDHLGYYSLKHDFPVMNIHRIYHKKDAIWHFTVVGRPPQEDSGFGFLIHQMVREIGRQEFPGIREIHAVDVSGVHPLLLAIGSERYMPFRDKKPEEILTQAMHLLGKGQTSLAKYVLITTNDDNPSLSTHNIPEFLQYILERIDWSHDLHFMTETTMDTLDYSGSSWNAGSKLIISCHREKLRTLDDNISIDLLNIPGIRKQCVFLPGILLLEFKPFADYKQEQIELEILCKLLESVSMQNLPLVILVDDLNFCKLSLDNFLWAVFTRSNPAKDIYGVRSFTDYKHWGCKGPLVIDARIKPHHAPVLEIDPEVSRKVDKLFMKNSALRKFI
ncbi:MAG: UbiD family decarboxylase [Saprospiraceae bacterium]